MNCGARSLFRHICYKEGNLHLIRIKCFPFSSGLCFGFCFVFSSWYYPLYIFQKSLNIGSGRDSRGQLVKFIFFENNGAFRGTYSRHALNYMYGSPAWYALTYLHTHKSCPHPSRKEQTYSPQITLYTVVKPPFYPNSQAAANCFHLLKILWFL